MSPELWEARRLKVAECAYLGMTISEAVVDTGLSQATVRKYAHRYGIKFTVSRGRPRKDLEAVRGQYQSLADAGLTMAEAAQELGVSYPTLVQTAHKLEIKFKSALPEASPDRAEAMASMYRAGKTLADIGAVYGVTRERVRQIITKTFGIHAEDGGMMVRAKLERDKRRSEREAKCFRIYGCSTEQLRELKRLGKRMLNDGATPYQTPTGAFRNQRNNAKGRGIEWNLTLWSWWTIWQESGKWDERGRRGDGYVMCRFRDDGPYEIGNVYIATLRHNSSLQPNNPYRKDHPDFEQAIAEKSRRLADRRDERAAA